MGDFYDPRTGFFRIYVKFQECLVQLVFFKILYQFTVFYQKEGPLGSPRALKLTILYILITFKDKTFVRYIGLTKALNLKKEYYIFDKF